MSFAWSFRNMFIKFIFVLTYQKEEHYCHFPTIHYKAFSGIGWANYEIKSSIEFNYRTLVLPTSDYQFFQVESIHDYPPVRTGVCID